MANIIENYLIAFSIVNNTHPWHSHTFETENNSLKIRFEFPGASVPVSLTENGTQKISGYAAEKISYLVTKLIT